MFLKRFARSSLAFEKRINIKIVSPNGEILKSTRSNGNVRIGLVENAVSYHTNDVDCTIIEKLFGLIPTIREHDYLR